MNNLVIVKYPTDTRNETVDFTQELAGETIASSVLAASTPAGLTASKGANGASTIPLTVGAGSDGQSYGLLLTVTSNLGRVISKMIAVVINSQIAQDYQNVNLDAFNTLVDELQAGQAAVGNAAFMLPPDFNAANGVVTWELLDKDGRVYSSGTTFSYAIEVLSSAVKVTATGVINAPSDALPTLDGQSYQIRWRLVVAGQTIFSFESLRITSATTTPQGPDDVVELAGEDFPVQIILSKPYEQVSFALYRQNEKITGDVQVFTNTRVANGQLYQGMATGLQLEAYLEPYEILWTAYNAAQPANRERQAGQVFIINASIISAITSLRELINKAYLTLLGTPDMIFPDSLMLSYLRSGRDYFNGAGAGMLTAFTMLNAQGSIREYWIRSSAITGLRAQYLAEGEKAFNFAGQAISLDVDRTQYYQSLLDNLHSELDAELKPYKQNLIKKGIIGGDGNLDPANGLRPRPGATGAVGITISPASNYSKYGAVIGRRR